MPIDYIPRAPRDWRHSHFDPFPDRAGRPRTLGHAYRGPYLPLESEGQIPNIRFWAETDLSMPRLWRSEAWLQPFLSQPDFEILIGIPRDRPYPDRPERTAGMVGHFLEHGVHKPGGEGIHAGPFPWRELAIYKFRQSYLNAVTRWYREDKTRSTDELRRRLESLATKKVQEAVRMYDLIRTGHLLNTVRGSSRRI